MELFKNAKKRDYKFVTIVNNPLSLPNSISDYSCSAIVRSERTSAFVKSCMNIDCFVHSRPVDFKSLKLNNIDPCYVTFVNPSPQNGLYPFARMVKVLSERRPDIAFLVVEGRGYEGSLDKYGLKLDDCKNVNIMTDYVKEEDYLKHTRILLFPAVDWYDQPISVLGALINGIPVIASDRGGLTETVGVAGINLSLPDHLTPVTKHLPDPNEVEPWVEIIAKMWDGHQNFEIQALPQGERAGLWIDQVVIKNHNSTFNIIKNKKFAEKVAVDVRSKWAVLVPFLNSIEFDCEQALDQLESKGVQVVRGRGGSAIDIARNILASESLRRGFECILFIDADIKFNYQDALRLLARPEPVISGVYPKKGLPEFASVFSDGLEEVTFGQSGCGAYPLAFAAAGFLRIRCVVLQQMIDMLNLPLCNAEWSGGFWPFFQPMIEPRDGMSDHYLGEDWAFCSRLKKIGITPLADTSFRLFHIGTYDFTWENFLPQVRYSPFTYKFAKTTQ